MSHEKINMKKTPKTDIECTDVAVKKKKQEHSETTTVAITGLPLT
jgi:hypothetical protein